ncbi:hypothetical protein V8E53_005798 [Lactarius tabidus]
MPGWPKFKCKEVQLSGESYDFHFRELIPSLCALFRDPQFSEKLIFVLECHYQDTGHTMQVFSEMSTGKWWWSVQQSLESHKPGATVLPVIISSDKTQLTLFRSKSAYPIYLMISNIPKATCSKPTQQAQLLMGYIPTTWLKHIKNKAVQCQVLANLFHSCMCRVLLPLESYGETRITMATGNRIWYHCHPVLATFVGDYPEQSLIACTSNGRCPKCMVPQDEIGSISRFPPQNFEDTVRVFSLSDHNPTVFHATCHNASLKPIYHPFWECLPFTNIFLLITPDILHQLHQGILKHMVTWLAELRCNEINTHCSCLPPNHNAWHFQNGFTWLKRLTSQEWKDIACILLGVMVDLALLGALLDFIYLSQYPVHTTESLKAMDAVLHQFHENKDVFINLGVRNHFNNIPKIHSLIHYTRSITLFGTVDNYNTKQSECLHINIQTVTNFTKNAFQATNFKDVYKQMTTWLQCQEAIHQHMAFIDWCKGRLSDSLTPQLAYPQPNLMLCPVLTAYPSEKDVLANFIMQQNNYPELSTTASRRCADNTSLPFRRVSVFHKIKFTNLGESEVCNNCGHPIPGQFDTAFVKNRGRFHMVQVWAIFQLPKSALPSIFLSSHPAPPTDLAYVEWSYHNGCQSASIIPLSEVCQSVQLFPAFGPIIPQNWQSPTVLDEC